MNSTEQTNASSTARYKTLLLEARKLRGQAGAKAFDRGRLLVTVFEDRDFRADCGNIDDMRAAEILDDYLDDLCLDFLSMAAMLKFYPRRKLWQEGRLARMYRDMIAVQERQNEPAPQPRRVSASTRKELEARLEDARQEKARLESIRRSEAETLKERIAELEEENERLRLRVAELESLLAARGAEACIA